MNRVKKKKLLCISDLVLWGRGKSSMSKTRLGLSVKNIWMDSRRIESGDIFLALVTENGDGHNFVAKAFANGAVAAIVSKRNIGKLTDAQLKKCIVVSDPLKSVQRMAAAYRKMLDIPIIAITGSNGKTTTRHMVASVLRTKFTVGITNGNWNNHIGVPLSILRLTGKEDIAVIEIGANHLGEIKVLSDIVKPDIALITNIGYAHIGNFLTLNTTGDAKYEILSGLKNTKGLLLLNGDDKILVKKTKEYGYPALFFGESSRCGIRAKDIVIEENGTTSFAVNDNRYSLSIPGRHFIYSALPAIFIAKQLGLLDVDIKSALRTLKLDGMRGAITMKKKVRFILDCYNANPNSMVAAANLLDDVSDGRNVSAVIGDMLELGTYTKRQHIRIGKRFAQSKLNILICTGLYAKYFAKGAIDGGMSANKILIAADVSEALKIAKDVFKSGDTVLLKGSRGVKLEIVFERF